MEKDVSLVAKELGFTLVPYFFQGRLNLEKKEFQVSSALFQSLTRMKNSIILAEKHKFLAIVSSANTRFINNNKSRQISFILPDKDRLPYVDAVEYDDGTLKLKIDGEEKLYYAFDITNLCTKGEEKKGE